MRLICWPFGSLIVRCQIACRDEEDGVVGFGEGIEPARVDSVAVRRRLVLDIEAQIKHAHAVARFRISDGVVDLVEEFGHAVRKIVRESVWSALVWEYGDIDNLGTIWLGANCGPVQRVAADSQPADESAMVHVGIGVAEEIPALDYPVVESWPNAARL